MAQDFIIPSGEGRMIDWGMVAEKVVENAVSFCGGALFAIFASLALLVRRKELIELKNEFNIRVLAMEQRILVVETSTNNLQSNVIRVETKVEAIGVNVERVLDRLEKNG